MLIKRFLSPNDLYEEMLIIKVLSLQSDRPDAFNATLSHCVESYMNAATANKTVGDHFRTLFIIAAGFFSFILIDRIYTVIVGFL